MSNFLIERANHEDNAELQKLCSLPAEGSIRISFSRFPDFFAAAALHGNPSETFVCREVTSRKIVGIFSVAQRKVFYENKFTPILYFSDLRIDTQYHGSKILFLIVRFLSKELLNENSIGQTIVFADNLKMLNLIMSLDSRSGKISILKFHPFGNYTSYMVKFQRSSKKSNILKIQKATTDDLEIIKEFILSETKNKDLFPEVNFENLNVDSYKNLHLNDFYLAYKNQILVGITGIWDQTPIRQTKINSYSNTFKLFRPLINLLITITNGIKLPKPGSLFSFINIHTIIIKDNSPEIFKELLDHISAKYYKSKFDYFLVGFDKNDPLNKTLKSFRNKRRIEGKHFLITKNNQTIKYDSSKLFYLESARI